MDGPQQARKALAGSQLQGQLYAETRQMLLCPGLLKSSPEHTPAINALGHRRQWRETLALVDGHRCRELDLHLITHSAAISAVEKSGQWARAVNLF